MTGTDVTHPAYGVLRPVTDTASVLLANNPGKMTLDGTNTWVLRAPAATKSSSSIRDPMTTSTSPPSPVSAVSRWC